MSSSRFPGKSLAPFRGQPLISHVIERVREVLPEDGTVVVLTSTEESDDPLAWYCERKCPVFRGDLRNLFLRFQQAATDFPAEWIIRISGDSPLFDPLVLTRMLWILAQDPTSDVVTNCHPRTFPHGHSVEAVRHDTLMDVDIATLTPLEREHVFPYFYGRESRYRLLNMRAAHPEGAGENLCVDEVADLTRLEVNFS